MSDRPSLDDYVDVATRIADFRAKHPSGYLEPLDRDHPYRIEVIECRLCRRCTGKRVVKAGGDWKQCPQCQGTGTRGDGEPVTDTYIVYAAVADDGTGRRGTGVAWERYPGETPYTAGSELMNAETSAWGRAIIALGASDSKQGIASREEVRNRAAERDEADATKGTDWRPPAEPKYRKAQRSRGTADETTDWTTGPPEDAPGSSTEDQQRSMGMLFQKAGLHAADARHAATARILGVPEIESSKELSFSDAAKVIKELQAIIAAEKRGT